MLEIIFIFHFIFCSDPPDFYPASRRVKARIGQTPPIFLSLSAPLRAIRAYTRGKNQVAGGLDKNDEHERRDRDY